MQRQIITEQAVQRLAEEDNTPAQIVLGWDLQHEVVTIPKSFHFNHIVENAQILNFELSQEDMNVLKALDKGRHVGADPYSFGF